MPRFHRYVVGMLFVIVGINLIGLWAVNVIGLSRLTELEKQTSQPTTVQTTNTSSTQPNFSYPNDTLAQLQSSLNSLKERLTKVEQAAQTENSVEQKNSAVTTTSVTTPTATKEIVVYIGSGSLHATDWTDLDSAVVEINSYNYPRIKQVVFEATLSIAGGNAEARLKNKDSGNVIIASEVLHNTSIPTIKLSAPFQLDSNSNEYIVQLRSSSGEEVKLDGARLRIKTY